MHAHRMAVAAALSFLAFAGCADPEPDDPSPEAPPTSMPDPAPRPAAGVPIAPPPTPAAPGASLQAWRLSSGDGNDAEVSLAVHPTVHGTVLAAWHADILRVFAALTTDGGATWSVTEVRDPALDGPVQARLSQEAFDATAAFSPDGVPYVLFGGQASPVPGSAALGGITLARWEGAQWVVRHVDERGSPFVWDAMHMAVSPDTGRIHVVAQSISTRAIGYYTSDDRGDTWAMLRLPFVEPAGPADAAKATATADEGYWYLPRVAAAGGGLVAVTSKAATSAWPWLAVSLDDGDTFGAGETALESSVGADTGLPLVVRGDRLGYMASTRDGVQIAWRDGGGWTPAGVELDLPAGLAPEWSATASDAAGLWTLQAFGGADASLVRLARLPDGAPAHVLFDSPAAAPRPYSPGAGDEYGGVGVAADGSVWAAWSDPATEPFTIQVVRVQP